jgi:lysozyme
MKKIILAILFCLIVFVAYFVLSNLTFKSDLKNRIKGIDISNSYKGELNWNALRENKGFVILRAVREVDTCKTVGVKKFASLIDTNFKKNWSSLKQHQIVKGAYHFFAKNVSAEEQFKTFSEAVKLEKGDLPPILDVEDRNCDMDEVLKWLELAKEYYRMTPILYSDYFFYKVYLKKKNNIYPIWLYLNESSYMEPSFNDPNCIFWQYKQDMEISNFQEKVDFNVFLGDSSEFYKLLKK